MCERFQIARELGSYSLNIWTQNIGLVWEPRVMGKYLDNPAKYLSNGQLTGDGAMGPWSNVPI